MYYIYLFSTKVCYQLRIGRRKIRFVSIFDRIAFHNSEHIFGVLPFSLKVFSTKSSICSKFLIYTYIWREKNERWELISTVQSIKTRITYRFCLFCDVHINFVWNNGMVIKNSSLPTRPNLAYFRLKHTHHSQLPYQKVILSNQFLCDEFLCLSKHRTHCRWLRTKTLRSGSFRLACLAISSFHFLYSSTLFQAFSVLANAWLICFTFFSFTFIIPVCFVLLHRNWFIASLFIDVIGRGWPVALTSI